MEQRLAIFAQEMRERAASVKSLSHHSLAADRGIVVEITVSKTQPRNLMGNVIWITPDKVFRYDKTSKEMREVFYYGDIFAYFKPDSTTVAPQNNKENIK